MSKHLMNYGHRKGAQAAKELGFETHARGGKVGMPRINARAGIKAPPKAAKVGKRAKIAPIAPPVGIDIGALKLAKGGAVKKMNIKAAIKNPGALHKDLHVPAGQKIPKKKIAQAAQGDGKTAQRARFAMTLSKMHKAKGGKIERC